MVYDQIEIKIRSLQALGIKAESYGSLLIPVVMEKIPEEFRLVMMIPRMFTICLTEKLSDQTSRPQNSGLFLMPLQKGMAHP